MTNEELIQLIKQGDNSLMTDLYEQNRRFILAVVKHIGIQPDDYEDAMQDAYFGLHEAVNGFDESKGYKFLTYAKYHIQVAIQRGHNYSVHIPEQVRDTAREIKRIQSRLTQELNRTPTMAELAIYADLDIKTIVYTLNAVKPVKSIYEPVGNDTEDLSIADSIEDKSITFENDIAAADEKQYISGVITGALNDMPEAEKEAISLFYFKGMTYTAIAELKQLTAAEVRRLVSHGLRKLRNPKISRRLLAKDIDLRTSFYQHRSVDRFKTTWTSSTEQTVMDRDYMRRKI
ncbi:MAG: sigma-70 family RNA polymerase sigma factor [Clostridia bacterium]|nr:sigma-70 family RNA polymerase sigma factor [Clostridia bacterium]